MRLQNIVSVKMIADYSQNNGDINTLYLKNLALLKLKPLAFKN